MGCLQSKEARPGLGHQHTGKGLSLSLVGNGHSAGQTHPGAGVFRVDSPADLLSSPSGSFSGPLTKKEIVSRITGSSETQRYEVPSEAGSYSLEYAYISQRGYYPESLHKKNQDTYCVQTAFRSPDCCLFGVFDGHGENGTPCAAFARDRITELLKAHRSLTSDPEEAYRDAFLEANKMLHRAYVDDSMSGTTAITVMVQGRFIYVANVGDSRAVVAERTLGGANGHPNGGGAEANGAAGRSPSFSRSSGSATCGKIANGAGRLRALDLSHDQTPFRRDECERVKKCGARVLTLDQLEGLKDPTVECWGEVEDEDDGDPPRLWAIDGLYPGTAFTRSIGDMVAEKIGVIAEPEVLVRELTPANPFIIIASDGVWEFLPSQMVVDMVAKYDDPQEAARAVVQESYRLWLQYETRTDDITCIVIALKGLDMEVGAEAMPSPQVLRARSRSRKSIFDADEGFNSDSGSPKAVEQRRVRRSLSRAKRKAIEAIMSSAGADDGEPFVPPKLPPKTQLERVQIDEAVRSNFLFAHLTEEQRNRIFDLMEKRTVSPGELIIRQGEHGEHFYIAGSGRYDVLLHPESLDSPSKGSGGGNNDLGDTVHTYFANDDMKPCFGELALMYNKPRAASVVARERGELWALDRRAFRRVLMKASSNRELLKTLRNVEVLKALTAGELQRLADVMAEESYAAGEHIIRQGEIGERFFIIKEGKVVCTVREDPADEQEEPRVVLRLAATDLDPYFGERALLNDAPRAANVVASGAVKLLHIGRGTFEDVLGPLQHIIDSDRQRRETQARRASESRRALKRPSVTGVASVRRDQVKWLSHCYTTRTTSVGLVRVPRKKDPMTLIMSSKSAVSALGAQEALVREVSLYRELSSSLASRFVPPSVSNFSDSQYLCSLINCSAACTLDDLLFEPVAEHTARYYIASVLCLLEFLHREGVVFRGVCADTLLVDTGGHLQALDFRFAKRPGDAAEGRTFTLCGAPDYLAPEVINGGGHGAAADMWSLGVLLFLMLSGDLPFGAHGEDEMKVYNRIVARDFRTPTTWSTAAIDLIDRLLTTDERERITLHQAKAHAFFKGMDWDALDGFRSSVPAEAADRVERVIEAKQANDAQNEDLVGADDYSGDEAWFAGLW